MNFWIFTVTLLLHITPCYLQQKSSWWSGQESPSTSHNSRASTSGSHPGGKIVNPTWNQAPKSWPNTEPAGWSASQKRQVTAKPRNMPPSSRHRPQPPGQPRPGNKNGARKYNWKPSVYRYPHAKKPSSSPQWSVKAGKPTWRAPGMHGVQAPNRKWGNSWGQKRAPGHQMNKAPKAHEVVKGWSTTGTHALWTDQGNPKKAAPAVRKQTPAWMMKRPTPSTRRTNNDKVFRSNAQRPPYQPSRGYTPKPYPRAGYTPNPYPGTGYTPKPFHRPPGNPHERHPPPPPPSRNDQRHRPSGRPGDNPVRNPQHHQETATGPGTLPSPHHRHGETTGFSTTSQFDSPNPREPVTNKRRPTRPRAPSWEEPRRPKTAQGGRFEPSQGETFHRTEPKRIDTLNHNEPPRRGEPVPHRKSSRRTMDIPKEHQQSSPYHSTEPRQRITDPRKERTRSETFTDTEPRRSNSVYRKLEAAHIDPLPASPNIVDTHEPMPSAQPNRISNTPKTDSGHPSGVTSKHKDPTRTETFLQLDTKESNTILPTETLNTDKITHIEPTHNTETTQTEAVHTDFPTYEQSPNLDPLGGETQTAQSILPETSTAQTITETLDINAITETSKTPIPQESVMIAVDVKPINPTKAAEPENKRDSITEKIIAELKRKLKIMSSANYKPAPEQPVGNVSVSVLDVMQKQHKSPADLPKETVATKTKSNANEPVQPTQRRKSKKERGARPGKGRSKSKSKSNPAGRASTSHAGNSRYLSEPTHNTDIHNEEVVEPRRTKSRRVKETPHHERSHRRSKSRPSERHANAEPAHHRDHLPEERVSSHRRHDDIREVGYYEGVTGVRQKPTSHPDDLRHAPRRGHRRVDRHHDPILPDTRTVEPTIEFIGDPHRDNNKARKTGRKRHLPDPRPVPSPLHEPNSPGKQGQPGELLSVYDSKTDTFIEAPPNFTPRPKSEGDLWGKSQPTSSNHHAPAAHQPPPDPWGAAPPGPHIPAPDPYAAPPSSFSNDDGGWSRRHPDYRPGTAEAFSNRHPSVNTDLHRPEQPGYAPDPYNSHPPREQYPYEYPAGQDASYSHGGPPEAYPPAGPPDPYHPAGPADAYPAVSQPGAYYQDDPNAHHPPPYANGPPVGPVDPYRPPPPPPTIGPRPIYHTPATIPTTTDDDPVTHRPVRGNGWYPTAYPPGGQHQPHYVTTPPSRTNFDPYPGPQARRPPAYDSPMFNQYTIRYPDGSASKEEYTEVTSSVQRIVNYVYDGALREYKIADYFVMDRNTDSFAIRIAKDMCYVGTLDSAILNSFTEYTLKTRNATKAVLYSNNRLFFFKEVEQVLFNDVNTTRGGYIAGSCGDAFMFTVRMVKPRIIHMNNGSILPGSTCPYGSPLKDPRGKISSCKSGYCESRDHSCHAVHHICCPKMPTSTRCMSLSIGKFCVTYSPHNVIIN